MVGESWSWGIDQKSSWGFLEYWKYRGKENFDPESSCVFLDDMQKCDMDVMDAKTSVSPQGGVKVKWPNALPLLKLHITKKPKKIIIPHKFLPPMLMLTTHALRGMHFLGCSLRINFPITLVLHCVCQVCKFGFLVHSYAGSEDLPAMENKM